MSTKEIRMSYAEYHNDLAEARRDGWHDARDRLKRVMKLTKEEIEMQRLQLGERAMPESDILQEIFEHFFVD